MFFTKAYLRRVFAGFLNTSASVEGVETKVDTVDANVDTIKSNVTTIDGLVDNLTTNLATANLNLERVLHILAPSEYADPDA